MGDVLKPLGSLLATDRSMAVVFCVILTKCFGLGVSCRILYSFVVDFYTTQNLIRIKLLFFVCRRSCLSDTKHFIINM